MSGDEPTLERAWGQRGLTAPPRRERGANGRELCRWCGTEVSGRRISWCSDRCVNAYLARQWPEISRRVYEESPGCRECGVPKEAPGVKWEVDHIVPVADGGDDRPDNLRLLCRPCHVRITTEWRRQRAASRGKGE